MNFTRNGKIARLPRAVRAELNERLAENEATESLLAWLHGLPEVRAVLAARFGGQPISEQNLSAWRQGGFVEWERAEGVREWAERMVEEGGYGEEASGQRRLAERMALPVLMELMQLLQTASTCEDLGERRRTVLGVARQITQLCRAGHQAERLEIERARWGYEEHQRDVEELTNMTSREQHRQAVEKVLRSFADETDPSSDDEGAGEEFESAEEPEEAAAADSENPAAESEDPDRSRSIKVHQGDDQEAASGDKGVAEPETDARAILRRYELGTLSQSLLVEQTMPFREIIVGSPGKRPPPERKKRPAQRKKRARRATPAGPS